MKLEILNAFGIQTQAGLKRMMNDPRLYETLLRMFLKDDTFARLRDAHERRDYKRMFACAHELKGASGNVELTPVYQAVCPLVECLRAETIDEALADELYARLETAYAQTIVTIKRALEADA